MTNGAAIGYMILATEGLNLTKQQKEYVIGMMLAMMDEYTEEEAEEVYRKS